MWILLEKFTVPEWYLKIMLIELYFLKLKNRKLFKIFLNKKLAVLLKENDQKLEWNISITLDSVFMHFKYNTGDSKYFLILKIIIKRYYVVDFIKDFLS